MLDAQAKEGLVHECVSCHVCIKTEPPTGGLSSSRLVESMCDPCIDALMAGDKAFKTRPRRHQAALYPRVVDLRYFALQWEMGLGKTKLICDVASHHFLKGRIDAMLVLAPNEVYTNWLTEELPVHMGAPYVGMAAKTRQARV
jgi:hypothetical protein